MKFSKKLFFTFSILLIFTLLDHPVDAKVYKWKDENGKTHFTDSLDKIPYKYRKSIKKRKKTSISGTNLICEKPLSSEQNFNYIKSRKGIEIEINEIKTLRKKISLSNSQVEKKLLKNSIGNRHKIIETYEKIMAVLVRRNGCRERRN